MAVRGTNVLAFQQFRIVLPLVLLAASLVRFNALSFIYLVCLLITPLLKVPSWRSMAGATGRFVKLMIPISLLPVLGHVVFHVTLVAMATDDEPYGSMFSNCSSTERLVRQIGYQRLDKTNAANIIRLVAPDASVLITSIINLIMFNKLCRQGSSVSSSTSQTPLLGGYRQRNNHQLLRLFVDGLQNLFLLAAGVIVPSVLGGIYFIMFLILLTLWGCYKSTGHKFGYVRVLLLIYTGLHILLLYLYQFQFFQEALAPQDLVARIVGLTGMVKTDCDDVDSVLFHSGVRWSVFVNPGLLLILYWILACNTNLWCEKKIAKLGGERKEPVLHRSASGERQRLVEHEEPPGGHYGGLNDAAAPEDGAKPVEGQISQEQWPVKRRPWMSVILLIMKQSYVMSLIAMMAWSITYHSWLTFAFLLTACILWMLPNSRKWCLRASPVVLAYAELYLIGQYIFGMDIDDQLPKRAGDYKLDEIGFKRFTDPCLNLALQTFYLIFLVLTMRQWISERSSESTEAQGIRMKPRKQKKSLLDKLLASEPSYNVEVPMEMQQYTYDSKTMIFLGQLLWLLLCKYWIIFCIIMMAVISLQDVVIYRIIYMFLFLLFILIFQLNFTVWRAINAVFWWVVIVYSMLVLVLIYTYQFEEFHNYWTNVTHFDDDLLRDIGLERYDTAGLFVKLLTPTSFLVFVILQLRYFHQPFMQLSALDRYKNEDEDNAEGNEGAEGIENITEDEEAAVTDEQQASQGSRSTWRNCVKRNLLKLSECWGVFCRFAWRLTEIHIFKLVTLVIICVSVHDVSALTAIYCLLVAIFLPIGGKARRLLSHLLLFWTVIIILAKMIYQLSLVETEYWKTNCSEPINSTIPGETNNTVEDNAVWFGLIKTKDTSLSYYIRWYFLILVLIAFESITHYHQQQRYNSPRVVKPARGILFVNITRPSADESVLNCIKFFANYFFYKFGLECCFIMTAITASVRVDAVALIYIVIIVVWLLLPRRTLGHIWPIYKLALAILLAIQFLVCLGFPPGACIIYPWIRDHSISRNLQTWLFLPEYSSPPESVKLIADFLQLLVVCLQGHVFSIESNHEEMLRYGGGDNADILDDVEQNKPIPCSDFTIEQTKGIDLLKYLIFENMFWVTMAIIFITGVTRINIFSLVYVIAVFCFMWFGKEFLVKPLRSLLRIWNIIIGYCILVLFLKTALQLVGCVYLKTLIEAGQCWLLQLFGVNCLLGHALLPTPSKTCIVEEDDAGLAWDVVCLTFLFLQRRIYSSHYFRHIVDTIQAQNNLVSRGAELINRIMIREVKKQNDQEKEVLIGIKKQMKDLKKKQANLKKDYKEPEEHFQAIRAGDYYLFEDDESEDTGETTTSLSYGQDPEDEGAKPTPLQVVNTAYDQDMETAIDTYEDDGSAATGAKDEVKEDKEEAKPSKPMVVINFITTLWYSFIDWLIGLCNRLSRNYRLVAKKLSKELVVEKGKILRLKEVKNQQSPPGEKTVDNDPILVGEVRVEIEEPTGATNQVDGAVESRSQSMVSLDELEKEDRQEIKEQFASNKHRGRRLMMAVGLLLASRSEMLCYFLMILNQMVYSSLLSLPLPLMVFLWGMLSVPRPSKTFWVTVITYTEAVVVCKYLFQFGFYPWNDGAFRDSPFFPPRIIGIEKTEHYANVDIALLLALFLHRSILRKYGLWRDAADITADLEAAGEKEQNVAASESGENVEDEDMVNRDSDVVDTIETKEKPKPPSKIGQGISYIMSPFTKFFKQVTESSYNATADVYAPMFFCDFILFLVLVFGFSSFGPAETTGDGDVTSYLEENKIPVPFLIMLITQFIFIVIDRAIFLRKFVLGKFIFQIFLVILLHIWMFFILPAITKRSFYDNGAAQLWYFIKCIYFGLSAYQIRCGYPNRILGNFLTKNYSYANLFLFKGFLAIPFLLELRALMDWIWTDSTLAVGNWLQMEDIYANIFVLKCWREIEKTYPQERSIKKSPVVKYVVGGALLVVIIFIIWFPLVFFSFFNAVFISNPPFEASITVGIGGYQPMFTTTALGESIRPLTEAEFSSLRSHYSRDRNAYSFLSGYDASDVTLVAFDGKSLSIWGISPVSQAQMAKDLADNSTQQQLDMTVDMKFSREPDQSLPGEVSGLFEVDLEQKKYRDVRWNLSRIIGGKSDDSVNIQMVFPRFIRLASKSKPIIVTQLLDGPFGTHYSNISLQLESEPSNNLSEWWNLNETMLGPDVFNYNPDKKATTHNKAYVITFNDRKAPASLSFLSGYGIIGLYISFILLIGRLLRLSTTNQYLTIMFRELPDVNNMLQLILNIYLVREMKEFHLEEDLYAKLIFLYRSPETTIKWTRQTIRIGNIKKKKEDEDKKKKD